MRQTTKNILGVAAIVVLSSGVAGLTTYKLVQNNQSRTAATFEEIFEQNPNSVRLTAFDNATQQPIDLTAAAESSVHSVVHIRSQQNSRTQTVQDMPDFFDFFFGDGSGSGRQRQIQTQPRVGFGSGVIISKDGYIVTNNHVVENADEITVKLNDERELMGRVIGTDPDTDLALIKVEGDDFPSIPVGDSDALKVGEWVLAVGNPFNLTSTVTAGIVSAKARSIGTTASNGQAANIQSFIQTDAAINSGNSGGALVNARGELVGINAMLYSPTGAYSGYGFAIPTSIMTKVVADLKQFGSVQRALLGIRGNTLGTDLQMDEQTRDTMKKRMEDLGVNEGVFVAEVVDDGSAAGVLKVDDVITGIDGKKIHTFSDLQEALAKYRPGDKIKVTVVREKKTRELDVTLKNAQNMTQSNKEVNLESLGAEVAPVSDSVKRQLRINAGLEVTGVKEGKLQEAGIRRGFIILRANGETMNTVSDLENVLKTASQSPDQVLFVSGIYPSGRRANFAVDLSQD